MHALELIRKKHAGHELSPEEIDWLVSSSVGGAIPDYQLSALLMAINYEHLSFAETLALTRAFVNSGETLSWPAELGTFVDKHSTGGVGDKVSLILLPLLASMGFKVAKMSGRALGFTGGTIDKLESIPGFRTKLTRDEMLRVVSEVGCCIVEQTNELVPADKLFYALRDATDTVEEVGLIAASVMSKKIACGAQYIVLDVKCGSGAFFKTEEAAIEFALLAAHLGQEFSRKVGCVVTSMEQPLGQAIGNAIEVMEVIRFLTPTQWNDAKPPAGLADLFSVVEKLAVVTCTMAGKSCDEIRLHERVTSGELLAQFGAWIKAQGGDLVKFVDTYSERFRAERGCELRSSHGGTVFAIDAAKLETALHTSGGGRKGVGEEVDHSVGLLLHAKRGSRLERNDPLLTVFISQADHLQRTRLELLDAFQFADEPFKPGNTIIRTVM